MFCFVFSVKNYTNKILFKLASDKRGIHIVFVLLLHENLSCGYSIEVPHRGTSNKYPHSMFFFLRSRIISGSSCSKLTTVLVNDSLKFTSSDTQIC